MGRKSSRVLAIYDTSGEHMVFPSIQVASDWIYTEGFAGDKATNSSVCSFVTRVSKDGGNAYGFTFVRVDPELTEEQVALWAESLGNLAKLRAMADEGLKNRNALVLIQYASTSEFIGCPLKDAVKALEAFAADCAPEEEGSDDD